MKVFYFWATTLVILILVSIISDVTPQSENSTTQQPPAEVTTQPPVVTTQPPVVTTQPPVVTTQPPVVTTQPPVVTTQPPVVTTQPPVVTTQPPVMTTQPPVVTTQPPVVTTQPPVVTTQPPVVTTQPPVVTTQPPVVTTQPAEVTTQPPVVTTQPPVVTTQPPVITTQPPVVTTQPPVVTTQPPVITTQPPVITTQPPVVTTQKPFSCDDVTPLNTCHCYQLANDPNSNLRCENNIDDIKFNAIVNRLKNFPDITFNYLLINKTQITSIGNGAFGKLKFNSIYIENNENLKSIDKEAFVVNDKTINLVIKNNPQVKKDVFDVVNRFNGITHLELDENNISEIPKDSLKSFPNLNFIGLQNQKVDGLQIIKTGAINDIPSLTELLLENNKLSLLEKNAIDVSKTPQHVYINLAKNLLNESSLSVETIVTPAKNVLNITINLQNNPINTIKGNSLFQYFAESSAGIISIGINGTKCSCKDLENEIWLKDSKQIHRIYGLISTVCTEGKTLGDCLGVK